MAINIIILVILVLAALWTVMTRSLLRSAIGLAFTSVVLTVMIFKLNAPLAAVFELSVCAGLISVLFVSTIGLAHPLSKEQALGHMRSRLVRFWYLPVIVLVLGIVLSQLKFKADFTLPVAEVENDARIVLWNLRQFDLFGQIIILLAGVFGVVILFKEKRKK